MAKFKKGKKDTDHTSEKEDVTVNFLEEQDVFKILLTQMQNQLVQIKEQEIALIKEKAMALLEGEEKERIRVSREIHDGIGQMLTAIKLATNSIKGQDELKTELKKMIDETIEEARQVSFNLMPSVLLNFGLFPSVKILMENAKKYSDITVNYSFEKKEILSEISFDKSITIYRLIQEAFNNVLKHANAKNVVVKIGNNSQFVTVLIKDDGDGFDLNNTTFGKGLSNMHQRAELSGGKCYIESKLGEGVKIFIEIPL
ncbi:MAG TPA: sensor histidine kinase [Cytophagaceae bacterium]|jgi:two-component system NarL family sensor kinase|nr:sensor histidine kinase [Cytophagaceae bacterium]